MKKSIFIAFSFILALSCAKQESYISFVDTSIGTGGHGHVFVGASVPFGMVQLGPTSIPQQWDWCSGYHESDSTVIGFSHTHLSGTGIGDQFDVTVIPVIGDVKYTRGGEEDPDSGLWSYADRSREISRPGYYSAPLLRYGITAEMTATSRVGLHRYTFPASDKAAIVIDLENGGCWDRPMDTHIEVCGENAIRGYRFSRGWADNQKVFFYAEFSKPFQNIEVIQKEKKIWENESKMMNIYARADFQTTKGEQVMMKGGISPVSMEGACANLRAEMPDWDFDGTVAQAQRLWNDELGRIRIKTSDADVRKIFYTALYHTMIAPSIFCDTDGAYRGADGMTHENPGYNTHTTYSLWDTYRAAMPLYSIFQTERYTDMLQTMLAICDEQGKLPVWHLHGCETNCMVGNPGIIPMADAIVKDLPGIDQKRVFEAIKVSAMRADRGQDHRMKFGHIPCDLFNESVAYDLEYALADGAAALAAQKLAQSTGEAEYAEAYEYFSNRSQSYKRLFAPSLRFIRGKDSRGEFRKEYSPFRSTHREDDYCEGNGWQYTWLVPHDFDGLVECFGSKEAFICKLDSLFTVSSTIEGEDASPDISGLIGQYAHGNEPSHHIIYLYTMAGEPWKTADRVREVVKTLYSTKPDGLSGNEDVGQMSAWYILSAMGFYQAEPGSGRYWFGSPIVDKAEICTENGTFRIVVENNSEDNKYIQSVELNGKAYDKGYIEHKDIAAGGTLTIRMGQEKKIWY